MFSRLFGLNQRGVSWFVMAGEYDRSKTEGPEKMIGVSRVFVHERFRDFDNDIGLTILSIFVLCSKIYTQIPHNKLFLSTKNGNNKNSIICMHIHMQFYPPLLLCAFRHFHFLPKLPHLLIAHRYAKAGRNQD